MFELLLAIVSALLRLFCLFVQMSYELYSGVTLEIKFQGIVFCIVGRFINVPKSELDCQKQENYS